MKRIIWLAALLLAAGFGRQLFSPSDVARLQPVEVLRLEMRENKICVETNTGELGVGKTLAEAFADLKAVTAGVIFLDTVEYVLLSEDHPQLAKELMQYLRPACRVCLEVGEAELEKVAAYLDIHQPGQTLMDCQGILPKLSVLVTKEGRMTLVP